MSVVFEENNTLVTKTEIFLNAKDVDPKTTILHLVYAKDKGEFRMFSGGKWTKNSINNHAFILIVDVYAASQIMEPLLKNLNNPVTIIQFTNNPRKKEDSVEEMAELILPAIEISLSKSAPFKIISFTFGCSITLEVARLLEKKNYYGKIGLIEGPPMPVLKTIPNDDDNTLQTNLVNRMLSKSYPKSTILSHQERILNCASLREKIDYVRSVLTVFPNNSAEETTDWMYSMSKKVKALFSWNPDFKLKTDIHLFQGSDSIDLLSVVAPFSDKPIRVKSFSGGHYSVLRNKALVQAVDEFIVTD